MPEFAEVAIYARDLNAISREQPLEAISFPNRRDWGTTIVPPEIQRDLRAAVGKKIYFRSYGKALQIFSTHQADSVVEFRLGMTGQFHLTQKSGSWKRHYFLALHFKSATIYYADPRRFSRVLKPQLVTYALGGYDPKIGFWLQKSPEIPKGFLTAPRITWLLNSGNQTGVGNYLAIEALGRLNLSPFVPCTDQNQARLLLRKCQEVARQSFRAGGHSFNSGYFLINGAPGSFAEHCQFYRNPKVPRHLYRGRPVFSHFIPRVDC